VQVGLGVAEAAPITTALLTAPVEVTVNDELTSLPQAIPLKEIVPTPVAE
jgi:hypothetical protein